MLPDIASEDIEKAFQVDYKGTALDTLYKRLTDFHDKWYNNETPYLSIIQSSGSGKTRLVGELRSKGIYVLYICKRADASTGYPLATPSADDVFEKIKLKQFHLRQSN